MYIKPASGSADGYTFEIVIDKGTMVQLLANASDLTLSVKQLVNLLVKLVTEADGTAKNPTYYAMNTLFVKQKLPSGFQLLENDVVVNAADFDASKVARKEIVNKAETTATTIRQQLRTTTEAPATSTTTAEAPTSTTTTEAPTTSTTTTESTTSTTTGEPTTTAVI